MRFAFQALCCGVLLLPWQAFSAQPRRGTESARSAARQYASASQWARTYGFEVKWLQREEKLQIGSTTATVILKADSREATVNGVQVWLSFPVARVSGSLHVSQLDLRKTLLPLLVPPRNRPGEKVLSVCIDPGHGGRDPGNQTGPNQEKNFTLALAKELRDLLTRAGFKTMITRTTDKFIELPDRIAYANRRKASLFLCLHFNAAVSSRSTVRGAEVFCLTPAGASSTNSQRGSRDGDSHPGNRNDDQNLLLAYHIQKALTRGLALEDRGVRRARFAVLRDAAMPAALVEAGFMSHPVEGRRIGTAEYRKRLARAIAEGVAAYKQSVQK